jgi:hypothetical protein
MQRLADINPFAHLAGPGCRGAARFSCPFRFGRQQLIPDFSL